jgi:dephospho-CoA kinase
MLIGLTGGIASGKSTIGRRFVERGAVHLDADQLARDAVAFGTVGLARVRERFGDDLMREDGSLNRAALGEKVFGDPSALADLNSIVHPEVRRLADARIADFRSADPACVIIYEIPLLIESGRTHGWDLILVAEAPLEQRILRLMELRGMSEGEARRRIAIQASDAERRAIADTVIDTSGSEADTIEQVDAVWERLTPRR